jgi:hypothetical protein
MEALAMPQCNLILINNADKQEAGSVIFAINVPENIEQYFILQDSQ